MRRELPPGERVDRLDRCLPSFWDVAASANRESSLDGGVPVSRRNAIRRDLLDIF
jgi:hypothetical protein